MVLKCNNERLTARTRCNKLYPQNSSHGIARSIERFNIWSGSGKQGFVITGGDMEFSTP